MNKTFTLQETLNATCDYYQVSNKEIKGKSRKGYIIKARKMYCYISREFSKSTLQNIGDCIGICHSDVLHHHKDIILKKDTYKDLKKDIQCISAILYREPNLVIQDIDLLKLTENYSKLFI